MNERMYHVSGDWSRLMASRAADRCVTIIDAFLAPGLRHAIYCDFFKAIRDEHARIEKKACAGGLSDEAISGVAQGR